MGLGGLFGAFSVWYMCLLSTGRQAWAGSSTEPLRGVSEAPPGSPGWRGGREPIPGETLRLGARRQHRG